jgi:RHS repeat-associated protein
MTTVMDKVTHKYLYQGKEIQNELGLETYDFEWRMYDPAIGRTFQMDPHAENYFSLSPYSWTANNPLLFVDPDGMDINFYVWEQNGDEWQRKKVNFNQLDKNLQKAIEAFAKTEAGNAFLSQFAKEGDKIGGVEFTKDGQYSKHEMGFDQMNVVGGAAGHSGFGNSRTTVQFYMKINTDRNNNTEDYAIIVGHEAFIHIDQYKDKLIQAIEKKDIKAYVDISYNRSIIANDRGGGVEHDGYIEGKPEFARMRAYINQLKNILNPVEVNKQIQKHDSLYKKEKK